MSHDLGLCFSFSFFTVRFLALLVSRPPWLRWGSIIQGELRELLLLIIKRSQLNWLGHLIRILPGHVPPAGDRGLQPELAGGFIYLLWPLNALRSSPGGAGEASWGEKCWSLPSWTCCLLELTISIRKWWHEWIMRCDLKCRNNLNHQSSFINTTKIFQRKRR